MFPSERLKPLLPRLLWAACAMVLAGQLVNQAGNRSVAVHLGADFAYYYGMADYFLANGVFANATYDVPAAEMNHQILLMLFFVPVLSITRDPVQVFYGVSFLSTVLAVVSAVVWHRVLQRQQKPPWLAPLSLLVPLMSAYYGHLWIQGLTEAAFYPMVIFWSAVFFRFIEAESKPVKQGLLLILVTTLLLLARIQGLIVLLAAGLVTASPQFRKKLLSYVLASAAGIVLYKAVASGLTVSSGAGEADLVSTRMAAAGLLERFFNLIRAGVYYTVPLQDSTWPASVLRGAGVLLFFVAAAFSVRSRNAFDRYSLLLVWGSIAAFGLVWNPIQGPLHERYALYSAPFFWMLALSVFFGSGVSALRKAAGALFLLCWAAVFLRYQPLFTHRPRIDANLRTLSQYQRIQALRDSLQPDYQAVALAQREVSIEGVRFLYLSTRTTGRLTNRPDTLSNALVLLFEGSEQNMPLPEGAKPVFRFTLNHPEVLWYVPGRVTPVQPPGGADTPPPDRQ